MTAPATGGGTMPNCDFYAAGDDHARIVDFVLCETSCRVFELMSEPGRRLREFTSGAVSARPDESGGRLLALWPVRANPKVCIERTRLLRPGRRASWRERLSGWGLIQLDLSSPRGRSLAPSHTNHNTAARAARWRTTYPELEPPSAWDFDEVTRTSARINRFIRSLAVTRLGPRVVLPGAAALFSVGVEAAPW
ncbi:MAG: hypothetical protein MUC96_36350 [Myxococcaceae bacterium]|nr:hypothetical protein [Myxococcaceae bacterium]